MDSRIKLIKEYLQLVNYSIRLNDFENSINKYLGFNIENYSDAEIIEVVINNEKIDFIISKSTTLLIEKDLYYSLNDELTLKENEKYLKSILLLNKALFKNDLSSIFEIYKDPDLVLILTVLFNYESNDMLLKRMTSILKNIEEIPDNFVLSIIFYNNSLTICRTFLSILKVNLDVIKDLITFLLEYNINFEKKIPDRVIYESISYLFELLLDIEDNKEIEYNKAYNFLNNCYVENNFLLEYISNNQFFSNQLLGKYTDIFESELEKFKQVH